MRVRIPTRLLVAVLLCVPAAGAAELPETGIDYRIEVTLDPASRMLEGRETIRWGHPGGAPLNTVLMHLYLYRVRPDVNAIIHTHPKMTIALTAAGHDLRPMFHSVFPLNTRPRTHLHTHTHKHTHKHTHTHAYPPSHLDA